MKSLICLSFMQMLGTSNLHIPAHIDDMIKQKVRSQFKTQYPQSELIFDQDSCEYKGQYWYSANGLVLEAEHDMWVGRNEQSVADILDGHKIHFSQNVRGEVADARSATAEESVLMAHEAHQAIHKSSSKGSHAWVAWTLGGIALLTGGLLAGRYFMKKDSGPSSSDE